MGRGVSFLQGGNELILTKAPSTLRRATPTPNARAIARATRPLEVTADALLRKFQDEVGRLDQALLLVRG
jgi:hypothetical protein